MRLVVFLVRIWLLKAWALFTLPDLVRLNLFLAPLWVLNFGMIVLGTDFTAARRREIAGLIDAALPFPVVVADSFVCSAYVDCVGNDNLYGAKSAMSYLIDQGHRRFCYLRARQRIANFDDREHGIRMALSEHLG